MDLSITSHTITRNPVAKNRFPKLCLKKNIPDSFKIEKDDEYIKEEKEIVVNTNVDNVSPISQPIFSTPPFVTKRQPTYRKISLILFNSETESSTDDFGNVSHMDSSKNNVTSDIQSTPNMNTNERLSEISRKSLHDNTSNNNISDGIKNDTQKSTESSEINISSDTANIMDSLYGDEWRSTPGLFKKKKFHIQQNNKEEKDDDDIIKRMETIKLSNNSNDDIIYNVDKKDDESNSSLSVKELNLSPEIELISRSDSKDENRKNSIDNENVIDLDESTDKLVSDEFPLTKLSPRSDDILDISTSFKPTKLNFCNNDEDELSDKENLDKPTTTKKTFDKPIKKIDEYPKDDIKNSKIPIRSNVDLENIELYSFMASLADNVPSWRREYKAKHYRDNFKTKKEKLAKILYDMFNEKVFDSQLYTELSIIWSTTLKTTAGRAHNKIIKTINRKGEMSKARGSHIELSVKVIDTPQKLRDTLAHEMCHVATWIIDGQLKDGHGPHWKSWVSKMLKCYPELISIPVTHSYDIHFKYSYKCTKCGYKIHRHSKSIDITKSKCGYCYGALECFLNKKTKDGLIIPTPVKQRKEITGFALYVKENYGNVRSGNTPHKSAMKYLGQQYAKYKNEVKENNP